MTVAEHLAASKAAHEQFQIHSPRLSHDRQPMPGDPALRLAALKEAYEHRLAAHDGDPDHTDPAWRYADWVDTHHALHDALLEFYQLQLGLRVHQDVSEPA